MAIIRLGYAADLPSPEDALRKLAETPNAPRAAASAPAPAPSPTRGPSGGGASLQRATPAPAPSPPSSAPRLAKFADVVALARAKRDIQLCQALENDVRLARFEPGRIEFSLIEGASNTLPQTLSRKLGEWTGERWMVALAPGAATPTLREQSREREAERLSGVAAHPLVRKVLERFPGAKIVDVRRPDQAPAAAPPPPAAEEEVAYVDAISPDDDL